MIPKVTPFDTYKSYLGLKNHFTKEKYDYHRYGGKSRASLESFYKRKDRFFFEKLSRQKDDSEVIEFFVSNFVSCDDPQSLWIGEIVRNGEQNYTDWKKRLQSLSYTFKSEVENVFSGKNFDEMFKIEGTRHPQLIKEHLGKNLSLESLVILNKILGFKKQFDSKLNDPVWKFLSMRIDKYDSFIHIDVFKFRSILKEVIINGT
ncbi:hypothetical protein [Synechococcus phage S-B05]|nr:DNA helicase loader [Synechococcus phage S-H68]QCW23066.1 hypothetical protein [Synechococcus phage S-B05]